MKADTTVQRWRLPTALLLAALMLATRQFHFGPLPDASWAVFFLGGLYLGGGREFAAFLAGAFAIDYVATQHLGVSSYCLSPAYVFLPLSYAALWLGGAWSARGWNAGAVQRWVIIAASFVLSISACFVISNGTFYWIGGRVNGPSLAGWYTNLRDWYGYFLAVPSAYATAAVLLRVLVERYVRGANRGLSGQAGSPATGSPASVA